MNEYEEICDDSVPTRRIVNCCQIANSLSEHCGHKNFLATMAYNIKRITNVLGATKLTEALYHA